MAKTFCLVITVLLLMSLLAHAQAAPATRPNQNLAPTYRIFATREGLVGKQTANGHTIVPMDRFVALPSWRVLSSYRGYEYQVRVTYNGRSVVVPVWDVGPWNTNDAYWSPNRGDYPDLPIGMPQAEAAFFNGHNGGLDEFGRIINNPNGIDIADGTFLEDLAMTKNDWVNVTFLWLGEDPGPVSEAQNRIPAPPPANPPAPLPPIPAQPTDPDPETPSAPAPPAPTSSPLDNPRVEAGATAVDDSDPGYNGGDAVWDSFICGLNGTHAWAESGAGSQHRATWQPDLPTGPYEVKAYIPPCGDLPATTSARYTIFHDNGQSEVVIDQQAAAGSWASLGSYHFGRNTAPMVELSSTSNDTGTAVRFDAIAWKPGSDSSAPTSRIIGIVRERNGYRLTWTGEDDLSGIESYDVQVRQLPRGGWRNWIKADPLTEAWFGPDEGKPFAFRVRARDMVGNEEAWRENELGDIDTSQAEQEP